MFRKKKQPEKPKPRYGPMRTFRVAQVVRRESDDNGTREVGTLDLDDSRPPWLHLGRAIQAGHMEERDVTGRVTAILHPKEAVLVYPGQHTQRVELKYRVDHTHEVES